MTVTSISDQGQNKYANRVITTELEYVSWQEAFICLTDKRLPNQLRASYCALIMGKSWCRHKS